jgi:hypothetical protein
VLALDLEDVKDAKERTGNQNQVAKLQVGLLVSGFVMLAFFSLTLLYRKTVEPRNGSIVRRVIVWTS